MPWLVQDRQLLEAFRSGRPEALKSVYLHYAPGVASVLRHGFGVRSASGPARFRGLSSESELQNGVQEVFARAFAPEARSGYDGLRPYGAYLAAIARNWVLNELRKAGTVALVAEPPEEEGPPPPSPETLAADRELVVLLESCRDGLGAEARALWTLRFEEQLSQDAAADRLGKTRIQVRRLEAKIKRDLLERLRRGGWLEGHAPGIWEGLRRKGSLS